MCNIGDVITTTLTNIGDVIHHNYLNFTYLGTLDTEQADTKVFRDGKWPLVAPLPNYGRGHPDYNSSVNKPFWNRRWSPFIDGYNLTNVTIGGENGTIDGSGAFWWAR